MMNEILNLIKQQFLFLIEKHGFTISEESSEDSGFSVIYRSLDAQIRLESYHRELYINISPTFNLEEEACIFNVINYINRASKKEIKSNYYHNIKSITESYTAQAKYIVDTLQDNMKELLAFVSKNNFKKRWDALSEYMINKHPEFFTRA